MFLPHLLADSGTVTFFKGWDFTGNFTFVDLFAASTNALNGALLARRPLGQVPSARTNPAYITLALAFGVPGYLLAYTQGQLFREGLFEDGVDGARVATGIGND